MFVVFEGIDGSGKSTLIRGVSARLQERGGPVLALREPGSTGVGERVRALLLDPASGNLDPWTEACLFTACRAELVAQTIRPALSAGIYVFLDRYYYSTLAYQGYGAGADLSALWGLQRAATGGLSPDLVVLVDVPVGLAASRRGGQPRDRMEGKGAGFLERVRDGFLTEASRDPERFLVVDGTRGPAELVRVVQEELARRPIRRPGP